MGKRGPKPTPTAILKLRNSWLANTRDGEPSPETCVPPCPSWLREEAAKHWPDIAEMLYGLGVMAEVYSVSLSLLVDALADWIELTNQAKDAPFVQEGQKGTVANPVHRLKAGAWERVLKACREFGMTPASMSGVKSVKGEEQEGLGKYKLG